LRARLMPKSAITRSAAKPGQLHSPWTKTHLPALTGLTGSYRKEGVNNARYQ
jgi:hypothetical protein